MSRDEGFVHAVWEYVHDLANSRHHTVFRKHLLEQCTDYGVKDLDRLSDHRVTSRTPAQKRMIIQSLVQV